MSISIPAALDLARDIYDGVQDKSGRPYLHHVVRVAQYVKALGGDEHDVVAALHHDSVEDGYLTFEDLISRNFSSVAIHTIDGVSRRGDDTLPSGKEPYMGGLIARCARTPRRRLVKLADNANNSLPRRLALLDPEHASIGDTRYPRARTILLRAEQADRSAGILNYAAFPLHDDEFMRYIIDLDDALGGNEVRCVV